MYICNDPICDPICDFCLYCVHNDYGTPIRCEKSKADFDGGLGYCDEFKCRLHQKDQDSENKPL